MIKVLIRGPLLSMSGYGVHARQIFKYLNARNDFNVECALTPWGHTPWYVNPDALSGLVGDIMQKSTPTGNYDISFQVQLPNEWDNKLARKNVGVTAAVETDKCNPEWVRCCNAMDVVIVPSTHVLSTLKRSGHTTTKYFVVAESYFDKLKDNHTLDLELDTNFNFLVFGQLTGDVQTDRKNTFNTIKLIKEQFSGNKDIGIVLKTNSGRNTVIDRQVTKNNLRNTLDAMKLGTYPKVYLLHGDMSEEEVCGLYKHEKISALVSLTHGEGYGLPLLEAAAADLPIIATNWSGHKDFLKNKFSSVDYSLVNVPSAKIDNSIFMQNTRWAMPNDVDAKIKLKKMKQSYSSHKEIALSLGKDVRKNLSADALSKEYDKVCAYLFGKSK
jgi:glycosyltransferase involved in cell wall biosynthesis